MSTTIALTHKHYTDEHLAEVTEEMKTLGAPAIRCIWSEMYGIWMAVEGCHRLRAAYELGLTPTIIDISDDEQVTYQYDGYDITVDVIDLAEELTDNAPRTKLLDF